MADQVSAFRSSLRSELPSVEITNKTSTTIGGASILRLAFLALCVGAVATVVRKHSNEYHRSSLDFDPLYQTF